MPVMIKLESGNLAEAGYEEINQELHIHFHRSPDSVYIFSGVPKMLYQELVSAKSAGTVFQTKIKGKFPFETRSRINSAKR